jgi:altronate dehydratase
LACNRAYGAKVQRRYHARLRKKALLQTVGIPDTNAGIVLKLKEAMSQWRKYSKAEAAEDINTFSQKKATAIAEEKNTTMKKMMKQLRLRDSQKRSATQIKMVRGELQSGGISRVTYLDENGVVHESTGREHLEDLCNKANEEKFQETADTPFTTGALHDDVGWVGI